MLDDETIARYARQIVIPGIGAAGQQKLLASHALVAGNERGCRQAELYLRSAGVRVVRSAGDAEEIDVVVAADVAALDAKTRAALVALAKPVCWYAVDEAGFTSGVHPDAGMPSATAVSITAPDAALHDAAACEAASVACAILAGLAFRPGRFRFEL
ncbi:MAG: hypothetical protein ABR587_07695 [Candidatus Binatia bacterium]